MSLKLACRPGDPQGIKASIAAAIRDRQLVVTAAAEKNAAVCTLFSHGRITLGLPDGQLLSDPNAIASYNYAGAKSQPLEPEVRQWLEWEETVLRPALYGGKQQLLDSALAMLTYALGKHKEQHLLGGVTLADVVVYATLLPLALDNKLPGSVAAYMERLGKQETFGKGVTAVLQGKPLDTVLAVWRQDSAILQSEAPKRPIPGRRNILITSALPYVNNVPHLGNIIGCVLSADCYARYARSRGYNAVFVCGTDEYGTATETKALEEGLTCQQICDKYHAIHAAIYEWFGCAFDRFGRTPTRHQTVIAQAIFEELDEEGQLVEQEMEQLYSEAAGKFLADRFVYGTCPICKYEDARGDQCDSCGNLLNPTELIGPRCKLTGTTPVLRSTRHYFLDLPRLTPRLQAYITDTSKLGGWSSNCVQVTNAWMRDGLKPRCITRDLQWGTPVPRPGYADKVFYVWFDAPIGYISITAGYQSDWQAWWQNPDEVELVQFMGKDNVPFHTVIFPATLLGTGQTWTLMRNISVTEYLNYEGGKFSKSRGVGVFGNDAKDTGIPVEVWRYYLLSNRPEQSDTDFKWSDLAARNNSELLANLGNFVNRVLSFTMSYFDGKCPAAHPQKGAAAVEALGQKVGPQAESYVDSMERVRLREGIKTAMMVSKSGNLFITETEPWKVVKQDPEECGTLVCACLGLIVLLAGLIEPYMPSITASLLRQLHLAPADAALSDELLQKAYRLTDILPAGHPVSKDKDVLFHEISEEAVAGLRERYAGSQSDRAAAAASTSTSAAPGGKPNGKPKAASKRLPAAGIADASTCRAASTTTSAAGADTAASTGKSRSKQAAAEPKSSQSSSTLDADGQALPPKATKEGGGGKKEAEAAVDISRVDLRVGQITKIWRHPEADSLYVEEVDLGELAGPRTVVSGLVKYYPDETVLAGRKVVVVANLKPANMRGVKSQAMVLVATSPDGATVELVEPPDASNVGEAVRTAGFEGPPDEVLNPKKKVFEQVQPELKTNEARQACFRGVPLATTHGPCSVPTVIGGSIK